MNLIIDIMNNIIMLGGLVFWTGIIRYFISSLYS